MDFEKTELRTWAKALNFDPTLSDPYCAYLEAFFTANQYGLDGWIISYLSKSDEISLDPLSVSKLGYTRTVFESNSMTIHPGDSKMSLNKFGIVEPAEGSVVIPASEVEVVIVPGLLFGSGGERLGRGKGFYDHFLAAVPNGVVKIGVVKSAAHLVSGIPMESHDVLMDYLVVENQIIQINI